jgi:hypothetical protein
MAKWWEAMAVEAKGGDLRELGAAEVGGLEAAVVDLTEAEEGVLRGVAAMAGTMARFQASDASWRISASGDLVV